MTSDSNHDIKSLPSGLRKKLSGENILCLHADGHQMTIENAFEVLDAHIREEASSKQINIVTDTGSRRNVSKTYVCASSRNKERKKIKDSCNYRRAVYCVAVATEHQTIFIDAIKNSKNSQWLDKVPEPQAHTKISVVIATHREHTGKNCRDKRGSKTRKTALTSKSVATSVISKSKGHAPDSPKSAIAVADALIGTDTMTGTSSKISAGAYTTNMQFEHARFASVEYLQSYLDRLVQKVPETVVEMFTCERSDEDKNQGREFQAAFIMPGFCVKLLKNAKAKGNLLLDVDYRHHAASTGTAGAFTASISFPDHSTIEVATMLTIREECDKDRGPFFELLDRAIGGIDENVGILSDDSFVYLKKTYPKAEFRTCAWHLMRNLTSQRRGDKNTFDAMVNATNRTEANAQYEMLTQRTKDYLEHRPLWCMELSCLSYTRLFWRSRTSSTLGECNNGHADVLRKMKVTQYMVQWTSKTAKSISKKKKECTVIEDKTKPVKKWNEYLTEAQAHRYNMLNVTFYRQTNTTLGIVTDKFGTTFEVEIPFLHDGQPAKFEDIKCICNKPQLCKRHCEHSLFVCQKIEYEEWRNVAPPYEYTVQAVYDLVSNLEPVEVCSAYLEKSNDSIQMRDKAKRGRPPKDRKKLIRNLGPNDVDALRKQDVIKHQCKKCELYGHHANACRSTEKSMRDTTARDNYSPTVTYTSSPTGSVNTSEAENEEVSAIPTGLLDTSDAENEEVFAVDTPEENNGRVTPAENVYIFTNDYIDKAVAEESRRWLDGQQEDKSNPVVVESTSTEALASYKDSYIEAFHVEWICCMRAHEDVTLIPVGKFKSIAQDTLKSLTEDKIVCHVRHINGNHFAMTCCWATQQGLRGFVADSLYTPDCKSFIKLLQDISQEYNQKTERANGIVVYPLKAPMQGKDNCGFHCALTFWFVVDVISKIGKDSFICFNGHMLSEQICQYFNADHAQHMRKVTYELLLSYKDAIIAHSNERKEYLRNFPKKPTIVDDGIQLIEKPQVKRKSTRLKTNRKRKTAKNLNHKTASK